MPRNKRTAKTNEDPARKPGARAGEPSPEVASNRHRASLRGKARGSANKVGGSLPTVADSPARRPGAQPGNSNALKHGFYSSVYRARERSLLAELPLTDLSAEIDLIRITNRRFLRALQASKGDLDLETQLTALRAVNLSAHSIATLLRAHALTAAFDEETAEALRNLPPLDDDDDDDPSPDA
ncbi:MAG: hypothetical protein ACK2T0_00610 [Anaerolineales bacterium]